MVNTIRFTDQLFHQRLVQDRVDDQSKAFLVFEVLDICIAARRKIINDRDLVSVLDKLIGKMTTDKSGSARDENFHKRMIVESAR